MTERVIEFEIGVGWDPICEDAVLVTPDNLWTILVLPPDYDDADRRDVVLTWRRPIYSLMYGPNDEARHNHRLYQKGLGWAPMYVVEDSELVADSRWRLHKDGHEAQPSSTAFVHYVVTTKGQVIEVVAEAIEVRRVDGLHRKLVGLAVLAN